MNTRTDESFGVIPVYKNEQGEYEILVIHQFSHMNNHSYWVFPKGHSENNENAVEAALRELEEETGIADIELQTEKDFKMRYSFKHEGDVIHKTVTFFVGFVSSKVVKEPDQSEVKEIVWLKPVEARVKLTHENTKLVFDEVIKYLNT